MTNNTNKTDKRAFTNYARVFSQIYALVNQFRNEPLGRLIKGVMDEGYDKSGQKLTMDWIADKTGLVTRSIYRIYSPASKKGK